MIEIICNKDESDKNSHRVKEGVTSIRRPKNIKQIGDVSSDKKIYIEDYAFTYINSIAYNNPMIEQAGVLLGELQKDSEEKCVFVKGVIKSVVEDKGERIHFDENVWNRIYSDTEKYFPNLSVVGWFAVVPEVTSERMARLKKIHLDNFAGMMKTLYLVDTACKEEHFYLYENGSLRKQKGYVCFYERNYEMQEYMLERNGKKSCEDSKTDKVMQTIRNVIKEKDELREQKKSSSFMYVMSTFLVVVIIVIGINLMNSYEKMKQFDKSINTLMNQMSGNDTDQSDNQDDTVTVNKLSGDVYPTKDDTGTSQNEDDVKNADNSSSTGSNYDSSGNSSNSGNSGVSAGGADNAGSTNSTSGANGVGDENSSDSSTASQTAQTAQGVSAGDDTAAGTAYVYTVKTGDTLMSICKKHYGTTTKYTEVLKYNELDDANVLYVGQEIKLP